MSNDDLMQKIVSLCKRRGFVFQSSEIYGGLKSAYDYGPLGVELKRNLMNLWWRDMVHSREDVVGLDASIMMHPKVWQASGHLSGFSDPLVDCLICKERFRADQAPRAEVGDEITLNFADKGRAKVALSWLEENHPEIDAKRAGKTITGLVAGDRGYVCPVCGSPHLSAERQFNLMFRSHIGPVDPMGGLAQQIAEALSGVALTQLINPGAPVVFGSFLSNIDMQSGSPQFGTPESGIGLLATGQIARHFGLPFRGGGGLNSSQVPDAQAGYEAMMTLMPAFLSGTNFIMHSAGWLEGGLVSSMEKFVIDVQLLEMLQHVDFGLPWRSKIAPFGPREHGRLLQ